MILKFKPGWFKKHKIISGFLVVLILILGLWVYKAVSLRINKDHFEQARATIDTIYADIVTKVGPPDNYKRTNFCNRSNGEFEQGRLSCDVGTSFIYGVTNEDQANRILRKVQTLISKQSMLQPVKPLAASITTALVVNTYYHSANDFYKTPSGMKCEASYVYDTPRQIDLQIKEPREKAFETILSCSDWAKSRYYPLHG